MNKVEKALIGTCLVNPESIERCQEILPDPSMMESPSGHTLLDAIYTLHDKTDVACNDSTLGEYLERTEKLGEVGGAAMLAECINTAPTAMPGDVESHAEIIKKDFMRREATKEIQSVDLQGDRSQDVVPQIDYLIDRLESIKDKDSKAESYPVKEAFGDLMDSLERQMDGGSDTLSTGFEGLDDRMLGISPTDFILLTAETGIGKTSMALQISMDIAENQDRNVLIYSGEMQPDELAMKLMSLKGISLDYLQNIQDNEELWDRIVDMEAELSDLGIHLVRESQPTIYDFKSAVRKMDREHGLDFVVLDYIQMLKNPMPEQMQETEYLNMVSSTLRDFPSDTEVPILAISRQNKMGDVYGSSQFKYDANYVIKILAPDKSETQEDNGKRMISVDKARLAKGGNVKMKFDGEYSRFTDWNPAGHSRNGRPKRETTPFS